jgi:hypothetical protein
MAPVPLRAFLATEPALDPCLYPKLGISSYLTYLGGAAAIGKSTILRAIARSVATGDEFLGCAPERTGLVYVVVTDAGEREAWANYLRGEDWALDGVLLEDKFPDEVDDAYWAELLPTLKSLGVVLVILDNYRGLAGTSDTDKGHVVAETLSRFRPLYRVLPTILAIHSNNPQGRPAHSKDIEAEARGRWRITPQKGGLRVESVPNHGPSVQFGLRVAFGAPGTCELVGSAEGRDGAWDDPQGGRKARTRDQDKLARRMALIRPLLPARQIALAKALVANDPDLNTVDAAKQTVRNLTDGQMLVCGPDGLIRERTAPDE